MADLGVSGHPGHHSHPPEAGQGPGVQLQGDRHQQGGQVRAQRRLQTQDGQGD